MKQNPDIGFLIIVQTRDYFRIGLSLRYRASVLRRYDGIPLAEG